MRARTLVTAGSLMLAALAFAGAALADGGGFSPVEPASPNAERISTTYWFIFGFAAAIFLVVEIALVVFIVRFRNRGRSREVEGPQIRGHLNLELAWTAVPVLILVAIAIFAFYELPGIKDVPAAGASGSQLQVGVEGQQFYWQYTYPNGVIAIDRMRVPVGRPVRLEVTSPLDDVIHSWWIPALGGKIDAIPGHPNHTWFEATKPGTYTGQCAEFCGIQHTAMLATVEAVPSSQFDSWLAAEARAQTEGTSDLGAQEFNGVCAKCHGLSGKGGVGPDIASSATIQDRQSLDTIVREGLDLMPAVGAGWSDRQMDALSSYLQKRFGNGG
ncbi:MAG: cytochrome c oxidase subunit II [Actinobacteria bacterium]|nr:cytochrome c oxidase subunit II [Actinomycetota bacterium]